MKLSYGYEILKPNLLRIHQIKNTFLGRKLLADLGL